MKLSATVKSIMEERMVSSSEKFIKFLYTFSDKKKILKKFEILIDPKTLNVVSKPHEKLPQWTELTFCQCSNCPLDPKEFTLCPVAANLVELVDFFNDSVSYEEVDVSIDTPERTYCKRTTIQTGVSSILGIYMPASGCPILAHLKPMIRFHLPFASIQETMYRAMSMYLVKQYLRKKKGLEPDWNMQGLIDLYEEIHEVNSAFHKRLSCLDGEDANVNALVILDVFADYINFSLDEDNLSKIDNLFEDLS